MPDFENWNQIKERVEKVAYPANGNQILNACSDLSEADKASIKSVLQNRNFKNSDEVMRVLNASHQKQEVQQTQPQ